MDYLFESAAGLPPLYVRELSISLEAFTALFGHPPAVAQVK